MSRRPEFLDRVLELMHVHYRWGGKDPATGLDCSGLVTHALWRVGGPDWRATHSTDKLLHELPAPTIVRAGDLALYGTPAKDGKPADADHVMVLVSDVGNGAFVVVGASGGDASTVNVTEAMKRGAKVKAYPTHLYRKGFLGFRVLPLDD